MSTPVEVSATATEHEAQQAADRKRLADLAQQSELLDVVLIEMVYRNKWVRLDLTAMEAKFLTADELVSRHFGKALAAVDLPRA